MVQLSPPGMTWKKAMDKVSNRVMAVQTRQVVSKWFRSSDYTVAERWRTSRDVAAIPWRVVGKLGGHGIQMVCK